MPTNSSLINYFKHALFQVRVAGESMWPELVPGKRYWATSLGAPRRGDYVIFRNPKGNSVFVKKISRVMDIGYEVISSVPWGSSSADFGIVPNANVIGRLL